MIIRTKLLNLLGFKPWDDTFKSYEDAHCAIYERFPGETEYFYDTNFFTEAFYLSKYSYRVRVYQKHNTPKGRLACTATL